MTIFQIFSLPNRGVLHSTLGKLLLIFLVSIQFGNYFFDHSMADGSDSFIYGEAYRLGSIYFHIFAESTLSSPTYLIQQVSAFILSALELPWLKYRNQQILFSLLSFLPLFFLLLSLSKNAKYIHPLLILFIIVAVFNPYTYRYIHSNNPYIFSVTFVGSLWVFAMINDGLSKIWRIIAWVVAVSYSMILTVNLPLYIAFTVFTVCLLPLTTDKKLVIINVMIAFLVCCYYLVVYSYGTGLDAQKLHIDNTNVLAAAYSNHLSSNLFSFLGMISVSNIKFLMQHEKFLIFCLPLFISLNLIGLYLIHKYRLLFCLFCLFSLPLYLGGTPFFPLVIWLMDNVKFFMIFKTSPEKFGSLSFLLLTCYVYHFLNNNKVTINSLLMESWTKFISMGFGLLMVVKVLMLITGLQHVETPYRYQKIPHQLFINKFEGKPLFLYECDDTEIFFSTGQYYVQTFVAGAYGHFTYYATNILPDYFSKIVRFDNTAVLREQFWLISKSCLISFEKSHNLNYKTIVQSTHDIGSDLIIETY